MKQYISLTIITFLILFVSCSQKHNIEGNIIGLGNDTIYARYLALDESFITDDFHKDTIISREGKFYYDSPSNRPIMIYMVPKKGGFKRVRGSIFYPPQNHIELLLKPDDKININGKLEDYYIDYKTSGSDFNEEYSQLRKGYIREVSKAVKVNLQLDSIPEHQEDKKFIDKLSNELDQINGIELNNKLNFVKNNRDKDLSAYLLTMYPVADTLEKYYGSLTDNVRNGIFKKTLEDQYTLVEKLIFLYNSPSKIDIGKIAPDFKLKSINGTNVSLNSISGDKIIILDFWGSWCGWCIEGYPKMNDYYGKYKNKIEIIGIACNDMETRWKKCLQENKLNWVQVINPKDSKIDIDVAVMYGIRAYPTKFILDKNKMILAKFVGETEEFYKKLDEILKN